MLPQENFKIRYRQIEEMIANPVDSNRVNMPLTLRLLLMDGLVDIVNREHRLKLRFEVGMSVTEFDEQVLAGFSTPTIHLRGMFAPKEVLRVVNKDGLLAFKIGRVGNQVLSIRDLIAIYANEMGGVHYKKTPISEALQQSAVMLARFGLNQPYMCLGLVADITRRGLAPLNAAVIAGR